MDHWFTWAIIPNAPRTVKNRKNSAVSYIALWKPDLNEQKDLERLALFRNRALRDIIKTP